MKISGMLLMVSVLSGVFRTFASRAGENIYNPKVFIEQPGCPCMAQNTDKAIQEPDKKPKEDAQKAGKG